MKKYLNHIALVGFTTLLLLSIPSCDNNKGGAPSVFGMTGEQDNDDEEEQMLSSESEQDSNAIIELNDTIIDLGDVKKGLNSTKSAVFLFYNRGKTPLVVNEVTTYCACTDADFTKEPIAPGKKGEIEVVFDADLVHGGSFVKNLQVLSNAINGPQLIQIKGNVVY